MGDVGAYRDDRSGAFVPEEGWRRSLRVVHLVELRVADTARVQFDVNLIGAWVREFDFVDRQGLAVFDVDCCLASHVDELLARNRDVFGIGPVIVTANMICVEANYRRHFEAESLGFVCYCPAVRSRVTSQA